MLWRCASTTPMTWAWLPFLILYQTFLSLGTLPAVGRLQTAVLQCVITSHVGLGSYCAFAFGLVAFSGLLTRGPSQYVTLCQKLDDSRLLGLANYAFMQVRVSNACATLGCLCQQLDNSVVHLVWNGLCPSPLRLLCCLG